MTSLGACTRRRLVETDHLSIEHCPQCAIFHVHLGPVSLRVDAAVIDEMLYGLATAKSAVTAASERPAVPVTPLAPVEA